MSAFLDQLARIGAVRLILMFGVAAGVAGALMAIAMGAADAEKALVYSGLDLADAQAMTDRLDQAGVEHELRAGGTALFVAKDKALNARLMLAAEGLPRAGSVGYEIFDRQDAFGATRFLQNVNARRAAEGELARTIASIEGVKGARVHLAIPERRLFERGGDKPKASVWIDLRAGALASRHAATIRNLVASAVPDLEPARVTILDAEGRLLAGGLSEDGEAAAGVLLEDRKAALEELIRTRVVDIVESVVGPGRVRAQVSARLDMTRVTESAEIFDPDGVVARATETTEESSSDLDAEPGGAVSVSKNVPGAAAPPDDAKRSQAASNRTIEVVNYEVSKTTRTRVREAGAVERITVAVAVDGETKPDADGKPVYTPRSDEELARIAALVRSVIGFDEKRGDVVEVANLAFAREAPPGEATPAPSPLALDKADFMRAAELGVMLVVAIMIVFLVARPLLKGALAAAPAPGAPALAGAGAPAALSLPQGGDGAAPALPSPAAAAKDGDLIDIARIEGQVRASSIRKVGEVVAAHPDESVAIIRNWLHGG